MLSLSLQDTEPDLPERKGRLADSRDHYGCACYKPAQQKRCEMTGAEICGGEIDERGNADGKHAEYAEYRGGDSNRLYHLKLD
jgi:hypothetical protein